MGETHTHLNALINYSRSSSTTVPIMHRGAEERSPELTIMCVLLLRITSFLSFHHANVIECRYIHSCCRYLLSSQTRLSFLIHLHIPTDLTSTLERCRCGDEEEWQNILLLIVRILLYCTLLFSLKRLTRMCRWWLLLPSERTTYTFHFIRDCVSLIVANSPRVSESVARPHP